MHAARACAQGSAGHMLSGTMPAARWVAAGRLLERACCSWRSPLPLAATFSPIRTSQASAPWPRTPFGLPSLPEWLLLHALLRLSCGWRSSPLSSLSRSPRAGPFQPQLNRNARFSLLFQHAHDAMRLHLFTDTGASTRFYQQAARSSSSLPLLLPPAPPLLQLRPRPG